MGTIAWKKNWVFKVALFLNQKLCEFYTTEGSLQSRHLGVVFDEKIRNGEQKRQGL